MDFNSHSQLPLLQSESVGRLLFIPIGIFTGIAFSSGLIFQLFAEWYLVQRRNLGLQSFAVRWSKAPWLCGYCLWAEAEKEVVLMT